MTLRVRVAVAVVLSAGALSACGSSPQSAIAQPTAVDIGFAQDMGVHHEQAIVMSQLALRQGTPATSQIAAAILSGQSQELGAMRGWLRVWNEPAVDPRPMGWMTAVPSSGTSMPGMPGMPMSSASPAPGAMDYAPMPGMATPAQMLRLTNARGKAFDVLFAQLMIRHHLGGIAMDRAVLAQGASTLVAQVAQQEIAEQFDDISYLTAVLRSNGVKVQ